MRVLSQQAEIEREVDEWIAFQGTQQAMSPSHRFHWGLTAPETVARLNEMKRSGVTLEALDKLFNCPWWGAPQCDECGKRATKLIRFGSEPDYDVRWQDLCADCIAKAKSEIDS